MLSNRVDSHLERFQYDMHLILYPPKILSHGLYIHDYEPLVLSIYGMYSRLKIQYRCIYDIDISLRNGTAVSFKLFKKNKSHTCTGKYTCSSCISVITAGNLKFDKKKG